MNGPARRLSALALAPLLALALASCGGNDDLGSADAQKDCVNGASDSAAAKALTQEQKESYCKCLLPRLKDAGVEADDDLGKAVADKPEVATAVRECATKYLTRGY
ncbi:MAG: hypothetical protein ACJ762_09370 [Solirubrobacteraceae bacterium]